MVQVPYRVQTRAEGDLERNWMETEPSDDRLVAFWDLRRNYRERTRYDPLAAGFSDRAILKIAEDYGRIHGYGRNCARRERSSF